LLANYLDRTLLRNDVALYAARQTDMDWNPSGEFVELVLNNKHLGNYYLCEQIRVDKNRVNIKEMTVDDVTGENVTGGYLVELDNNFDEINKFKSSIRQLPYMFKNPDEDVLQPEQFTYFQDYVNAFESALYKEDWLESGDFRNYIDYGSFADFWIIYELAKSHEPKHPRSCYMHKDWNGKLKAGPVWDFDYGTWRGDGWWIENALYYDQLFKDPLFVEVVKSHWNKYKLSFETIPEYIRNKAEFIEKSNEHNIGLWPILYNNNGDAYLPFGEAIETLILCYKERIEWLDIAINGL